MLTKCRRRCAFCFFLNADLDVKKGQIAHIDRDPSNSAESNLAYLCQSHHDEYDTVSSQTKGFQEGELKQAKKDLEEWVEKHRKNMPSMSSSSSKDLVLPVDVRENTPSVYNLRLPIYQATNHFASFIMQEAKVPYEELFRFAGNTHNALFLFGEEIENYCRLLYTKAIDLRTLQTKMERPERFDNASWSQTVDKETEIILWFNDQLREMKRKFYPYLRLGNQQEDGQASTEDALDASSVKPTS